MADNQLVQALLNRMDHLEYRLLRDTREQVDDLRDTVGNIQKARRALAEEGEPARAPLVASHRGPGAEAPLPAPSPAVDPAPAQAPAHTQEGRESPFQKFNKMVKSRPSSPEDAKKGMFEIATPPLAELNRLEALAAIARQDEELLRELDHPPGIEEPTAVTADLAKGAPLWQDASQYRSPANTGPPTLSTPLGSQQAMRGQPGSRSLRRSILRTC